MRLFNKPEEATVLGAQPQSTMMSIAVGCFAAVGGFIYGYDTGLINSISEMVYVRHLFAANGTSFNAKEMSIMTAILSLGTFFGALSAPLLSDNYGRRTALIVSTFFVFMVGNICQVASRTLVLFCIGRFITGLSIGVISAVVPIYQAEASPKSVRGAIIVTYQWAITWGLLVSSAISQGTQTLNSSASYRVPIGLQFLWSLILGIGMVLLPESPRYFVRKDDLNSAALALSRLRRVPTTDPGLIEELVEIKASHDYEASFGKSSFKDCFTSDPSRPHQLKRLMTGISIHALQQCSSINFIFYYGVNFFANSGFSNSYIISFITYAVNVICTVLGIFLVETMGRRRLLLVGGTLMSISNMIIAIVGVTTHSIISSKILVAFVCCFIASFAASWGPVVWVVCGEIFSLSVRGKCVALAAATNWLVNFAFAYITPYLVDTGTHTAALGPKIFFMWSGLNILGTIIAYWMVYETKGLSLEQINELYRACPNARVSRNFRVQKFSELKEHQEGNSHDLSLPDTYSTTTSSQKVQYHSQNFSLGNQLHDNHGEISQIQHHHHPMFNPNYSVDVQFNRRPPSLDSDNESGASLNEELSDFRTLINQGNDINETYDNENNNNDNNDNDRSNDDYNNNGNTNGVTTTTTTKANTNNNHNNSGVPDDSDSIANENIDNNDHSMNRERTFTLRRSDTPSDTSSEESLFE